jgi:hypothetical protein
MEAQSTWLWILTATNIVVVILLLIVIYGIMLALAVLAPEISESPLYFLLTIGLVLSLTGLIFSKGVVSHTSRRITRIVNTCALAFNLVIVIGLAMLFYGSTRERFLIPDGYKGDIYIVYGAKDGQLLNKHREITLTIPTDGILRVQGPMTNEWTRPEYYYQSRTGELDHIHDFWPSTIHPTPENLANNKDIGVFFPRTGRVTDSAGCPVEYEQFYVGTKAHLLTEYKEKDFSQYLREHPVCK